MPIETMGPARPFCSERCKTIDLGNWLLGDYRVASYEDPYDVAEAMQAQADALEREEG